MTETQIPVEKVWEGMPVAPPGERPAAVNGHDRHPPHDPAAERAVLGALLLRPDLTDAVDQILRDDDWYRPAHALIYQTIVERHTTGQPVDTITVAAAIGTHRTLQGAGGPLYINDLANDPNVIPDQVTWHAGIVAARGHERRTVELGTWLTQAGHGAADDDQVRKRLELHLAQQQRTAGTQPTSWDPIDWDTVEDDDTTPTQMVRTDGHALLYPGAVHMLSGEPTSAKTWIALHALLAEIQAGHDVAFIDFEDRARTARLRLLALGATLPQIRAHVRYTRPELALDGPGRASLERAVTGCSLVVIDGVTEAMNMHDLDLSSNPDIATFYALLPRRVANLGPTVLLIDHVVKDTERQGRWSIGGQHKVAGIDGAAYTVKNVEPMGRGKRGTSRLFIAKDRHGHVEEHALGRCAAEFHLDSTDPIISVATLDPPEAMPTTETGDMRPTVLMERVSRWLEVNPGSSLNTVKTNVHGKAQYVAQALAQLVTEGHVTTSPGARNTLHHTVLEPFRRDPETPDDHPI